ncbi:uncharacterized protein BDV17DRAFT_293417 [Aspergillus undulatus]|uniref:uncharacterized protein n=1 Tax=Aspergillus undulatus TaxID=1810928 RepID=UPI003CCD1E00
MTAITESGVAIAELIVYIPTALANIFILFRHGIHKQLGWIFLSIFCALRIAGAILQILSDKNPGDMALLEWAVILKSIGLSPLLLASLGFLKRVFDETTSRVPSVKNRQVIESVGASNGLIGRLIRIYNKKATTTSRRSRTIQLLHIPAIIALALAISGGLDTASSDASDQSDGRAKTRGAVVLFLIIYIALVFLWGITLRDLRRGVIGGSQKRIYLAVFLALPFMAVRVVYSMISAFGSDRRFSVIYGDVGVRLGMATIEEFVVVFMYTVLGVVTPRAEVKESARSESPESDPNLHAGQVPGYGIGIQPGYQGHRVAYQQMGYVDGAGYR